MLIKILKKIRLFYLKYFKYASYTIGNNFYIGRDVHFWAKNNISIGNNFYMGRNSQIECDVEIGNNVICGNNVAFVGKYDHDYKNIGKPIRLASQIRDKDYNWKGLDSKTIVEDDVWIGYGSTIMSGVKIGRGSIIAAGSIVTKEILPYSIVGGNPAKKITERFTSKEIDLHELKLYGKRITKF
ncbi:acyltransferase [bacterium]|nr:acyltransferase [bacterium]